MRMVRCGVVLLVISGAACGGGTAKPDGGPGGAGGGGADGGADPNRWQGSASASINRNVDILFLIDDSSSMRLLQDNLIRNFPTFITRLQDPPGFPTVQFPFPSQAWGRGDGPLPASTAPAGKAGIFQQTPPEPCTA